MSDPGARAGAHHRLDRGDQAARGSLYPQLGAAALVDVGLAVRDDDHLVALQLRAQQRPQPPGVPFGRRPVGTPKPVLEVVQTVADLFGQRRHLAWCGQRAQQAFAAQQPAHAGHPATQAQLGDDDGDQRDRQAQRGDEQEQVTARVLAAPVDETEVVQQHQPSDRTGFAVHRVHADVHRATRQPQPRVGLSGCRLCLRAVEAARKGGGAAQWGAVEPAQGDREQALILHGAVEQSLQTCALCVAESIADRIGKGGGDERAADVQVA